MLQSGHIQKWTTNTSTHPTPSGYFELILKDHPQIFSLQHRDGVYALHKKLRIWHANLQCRRYIIIVEKQALLSFLLLSVSFSISESLSLFLSSFISILFYLSHIHTQSWWLHKRVECFLAYTDWWKTTQV